MQNAVHLSFTDISKTYGVHRILNGISFTLSTGQRIGLIGPNGVGKSTLLKIIMGEIETDGAPAYTLGQARVGYLPQVVADFGQRSITDLIDDATSDLRQIEARMRDLEIAMGNAENDVMTEYAALVEAFENQGGYDIEYRIEEILAGLGVGHLPRDRELGTLSGGEKARLSLAMLLLRTPDVLLLDEPTNHLDLASLTWLETYLKAYQGAILVVSHDRQFLNRTVTAILEIDEHTRQIKHYAGNYDAYLQVKTLERRRWESDYEERQEEIRLLRDKMKTGAREIHQGHPTRKVGGDKFARGFFKGRVEVAKSRQIANAEERLHRLEEDPIPVPPKILRFDAEFDPLELRGNLPLIVSKLSKTYDGRCVLDGVTFSLNAHSRIVLVGKNGAGKSTLLRILAGQERADQGEVIFNPQVMLGYLDQDQKLFDPHLSVLDMYRSGLPGTEQQHKSTLLSTGLFRYEEINRQVGILSSGQHRKLQIARMMAERANLLLLDEPTNYISFDVLEAFENALKDFSGPIIAASHDRRFVEQFGGEVWEVRDGHLVAHPDGFESYAAQKMY